MLTLDDAKKINANGKCQCGTAYCADTTNVFDNNQGITSGMNSALTK